MGCKDDDTCDQPATKGEVERVYFQIGGLGILLVAIYGLSWMTDNKVEKLVSNSYKWE